MNSKTIYIWKKLSRKKYDRVVDFLLYLIGDKDSAVSVGKPLNK